MSLSAKKLKMMEIIMSIKDEKLLDQINRKVIPLVSPNQESEVNELIEKYQTNIEPHFDLDKIIKEQNYKGLNVERLDRLIEEMDIQESLDDLLEMI